MLKCVTIMLGIVHQYLSRENKHYKKYCYEKYGKLHWEYNMRHFYIFTCVMCIVMYDIAGFIANMGML